VSIRRTIRVLLPTICILLAGAGARGQIAVVGDGGPGPVKAQHLTVEMVSLGPAIAPGGAQVLGLVFSINEHWHVYWVNAGDSGEPPHIAWTLPAGLSAGPMQFPIPQRLPLGPLMDFGYEDEVAFPLTISAAATAKPGPVHLDAQVDWLVCAQVCLPGNAHLGIDLNVQPGAPQPAQEPLVGALGEALTLLPKPLPAGASFSVRADSRQFELTLIDGERRATAEFYPYDKDPTDVIANAADQKIEPLRNGIRLYVPRSPDLAALPHTLHGVFRLSDTLAYDVSAPVVASDTPIVPDPPATFAGSAGAIGLAFLGGILLNLMPCVFPVLFLKGLALVQTAGAGERVQRGDLRRHSLVYALGILASFWAIVAVLLLLRATGSHAGWGFQLQSPVFLAVLASFLFLFALSLAGQFDIGLSLTSVGGGLAQKQGYAGSFFTGVLATVVATPCTAPFMGAAVGFALAQSGAVPFAVFTALALGLAAPYVLLSWQPAWARLLPRPGAWMEVFKHITAAIFFATVIWLAWVYGQIHAAGGAADAGVNQIALLMACFLMMAIAGWVLGRWPAKWGSGIAAVLLIALGLAIPLSQARGAKRVDAETASAAQAGAFATNGITNGAEVVWQPYSQQALDAAHAAGHPVFIDFTAAWCLSCQYNERVVLKSADVESALLKGGVATMKADWTNSDPAITQKLASVGRAGVPTYVIYPAAASAAADVLPEFLTKDLVLKAIERDTK
jgi:thiol:disulfide interchange protein/DsbC/DsbD-like thiol-disulfide interchange protein